MKITSINKETQCGGALRRVPDNFSMQGVNKEFQWVNFPLFPLNNYKLSINLPGHVADLVGFF